MSVSGACPCHLSLQRGELKSRHYSEEESMIRYLPCLILMKGEAYNASLRYAKLNFAVVSATSSTKLSGKSMDLFDLSLSCQYWA